MPKFLTLAEMAERLRFTPKTFRKYVLELGIPHFKAGKNLRFDPHTVEAYLMCTETKETKAVPVAIKQKRRKNVISVKFAQA